MKYTDDRMIDTYAAWQKEQKIPVIRGFFIEDLRKVEVARHALLFLVAIVPGAVIERAHAGDQTRRNLWANSRENGLSAFNGLGLERKKSLKRGTRFP